MNREHFLVNILGIILLKVWFVEVNGMCFTCSHREDFWKQTKRRESRMKEIKEITGQLLQKMLEKKDICSHIFYSVAEIRARDDNREKKEGKPKTGFIEEPD